MTEIERLAFAWLEAGDALTTAKPAGKLEANRCYTEAQMALYRALRAAKSVSEPVRYLTQNERCVMKKALLSSTRLIGTAD